MRFTRMRKYERWQETPRTRGAIARSQLQQQVRLPLLAHLIAERQPSVDQVVAGRADEYDDVAQGLRDLRARWWRKARAALFALPPDARDLVTAYWNGHRGLPGTPEYLASLVHQWTSGQIDLAWLELRLAEQRRATAIVGSPPARPRMASSGGLRIRRDVR